MKQNNYDKTKPNIIYILADDMGYGDLSCLNENSKIATHHFDALAKEGMIFTDAHSSSAVCTPSRYSILTGRYNWRSKLKKGVNGGYSPPLIETGRMTVASMLKEKGYQTACIGKWHLGFDWGSKTDVSHMNGWDVSNEIDYSAPIKNGPNDNGFDYYYGISASLDMPPYVYIENDRVTELPDHETEGENQRFWRKGPTAPGFKHEEVLPHFTEKVLNYIENATEQPFFLYFPLPAPHTPILPTGDFVGKSGTNCYGDFVLMCDDVVGQVEKKLKEKGIERETILIYTSDNGCSPKADYKTLATFGHNPSYVFRGAKADIYEGGHRIPLIVKWPEKVKPESICHETVCLIDLFATVAEIVGFNQPDNAAEDSVSNLSLWLGKKQEGPIREALVHHSIDGSFSIRKGKWKLEMCWGSGGWSDPKPADEPEGAQKIQLYNLEDDISEKNNLCEDYPEIVGEMRELLTKYIKEGRSTKGKPQKNTGAEYWDQLSWIDNSEMKIRITAKV